MRKTSVSTSCSLTSSAMISSALMSDAARAAATASSIARSVAATGLLGVCRGSGRSDGVGDEAQRRRGGRLCAGARGREAAGRAPQEHDEEAEHERHERECQEVQPRVGVARTGVVVLVLLVV